MEFYFPFLTLQWKSSANKGTIDTAITRGKRDRAAMVSNLHGFLTCAGREPGAQDPAWICHFFGLIDMRRTELHMHWRSVIVHNLHTASSTGSVLPGLSQQLDNDSNQRLPLLHMQ